MESIAASADRIPEARGACRPRHRERQALRELGVPLLPPVADGRARKRAEGFGRSGGRERAVRAAPASSARRGREVHSGSEARGYFGCQTEKLAPSFVSRVDCPEAASTTNRFSFCSGPEVMAILAESGDHEGAPGRPSSFIRVFGRDPSASRTKSSEVFQSASQATTAIRRPSGETSKKDSLTAGV